MPRDFAEISHGATPGGSFFEIEDGDADDAGRAVFVEYVGAKDVLHIERYEISRPTGAGSDLDLYVDDIASLGEGDAFAGGVCDVFGG